MKKKFLLICMIGLTLFMVGCGKREINFETELPNNYVKVKGDYLGTVSGSNINYILMNDIQIKCSPNDLELIKMGTEVCLDKCT